MNRWTAPPDRPGTPVARHTAPVFDDWGDVLDMVPFLLLGSVIFVLGDRLARRRSRRQMAAGRIPMAARSLTGGAHPVLSPLWSGFRVAPHVGRLDVRHALINDEVTVITVDDVGPEDRPPRWREKWRMNVVDPRVLTVRTPEGPIELAVAADHVDWLRSRLAGADLPAGD